MRIPPDVNCESRTLDALAVLRGVREFPCLRVLVSDSWFDKVGNTNIVGGDLRHDQIRFQLVTHLFTLITMSRKKIQTNDHSCRPSICPFAIYSPLDLIAQNKVAYPRNCRPIFEQGRLA